MSQEITVNCEACDLLRACQWTITVLNQFHHLQAD